MSNRLSDKPNLAVYRERLRRLEKDSEQLEGALAEIARLKAENERLNEFLNDPRTKTLRIIKKWDGETWNDVPPQEEG